MSAESVTLDGQSVLVVDDDPDFREIVASTLLRRGVKVSTVDGVAAALERCEHFLPDLILMDVWMPARSGISGCAELRQREATRSVPIILMSAQWQDEAQLYRALESGATDVMAKQQSSVELLARVKAALTLTAVTRRLLQTERELEDIRQLLAICASCKQVRTPDGSWEAVERYIERTRGRGVTHGICPTCREELYGFGRPPA